MVMSFSKGYGKQKVLWIILTLFLLLDSLRKPSQLFGRGPEILLKIDVIQTSPSRHGVSMGISVSHLTET